MPLYRVLKGKLWINKGICSKGDEVVLIQKVAKAFGNCLELIMYEKPEKPLTFVTQPERNLPEPEEEQEEVIDPPPPVKKLRGRPPKKRR